jgi:hypothetical protein
VSLHSRLRQDLESIEVMNWNPDTMPLLMVHLQSGNLHGYQNLEGES